MHPSPSPLPASARSDLLESYQHRILTLEIDLRQMIRDGLLSGRAYRKRLGTLRRLKERLAGLQAGSPTASASPPRLLARQSLPSPEHCSPEEYELCVNYLREASRFMRSLHQHSQSVRTWVGRALRGRTFSFLTTVDLSRLRGKLLELDDKRSALADSQRGWEQYAQSVLKASAVRPRRGQTTLESLRATFYAAQDLSDEVTALRLRIAKGEEELRWMEQWLTLHESRYSQLSRLTPSPVPAAAAPLSPANKSSETRQRQRQRRRRR